MTHVTPGDIKVSGFQQASLIGNESLLKLAVAGSFCNNNNFIYLFLQTFCLCSNSGFNALQKDFVPMAQVHVLVAK
jgi:hypothetical protein